MCIVSNALSSDFWSHDVCMCARMHRGRVVACVPLIVHAVRAACMHVHARTHSHTFAIINALGRARKRHYMRCSSSDALHACVHACYMMLLACVNNWRKHNTGFCLDSYPLINWIKKQNYEK